MIGSESTGSNFAAVNTGIVSANLVGQSYTYALTTPIIATAGTEYWLSIVATNLTGAWEWAGGSTGNNLAYQIFSNSTFIDRSDNVVFTLEGLASDSTAVPEPSTLVMVGTAGVFGLGWLWRRSRTN